MRAHHVAPRVVHVTHEGGKVHGAARCGLGQVGQRTGGAWSSAAATAARKPGQSAADDDDDDDDGVAVADVNGAGSGSSRSTAARISPRLILAVVSASSAGTPRPSSLMRCTCSLYGTHGLSCAARAASSRSPPTTWMGTSTSRPSVRYRTATSSPLVLP